MPDSVNILRSMESFDKAEQFDGFSKVVIIVSDEIEYSSGDDTGRTLTLNCPWGTKEIADNILQYIKGFQYQPMNANGALVDPSAEIGDGISANGVYSGIYSIGIEYNSNLPSDISAPSDEEIDEEFPYKSSQERKAERQSKEIRASLSIQSDRITQEVAERQAQAEEFRSTFDVQSKQIAAKVSKAGGSASSFGWELTDTSWTLKANSATVLRATKSGVEITGKITATSGKIGGFDIQSNYLSYNGQTWGGTNSTGIYIGQSGIQLGTSFKVSSDGKITATGGDFTGTIRCDALYVKNASGGYDAITTSTLQSNLSGGAGFNAGGWGGYNAATLSSGAGWGFNFQNAVTKGSAYTPNYFKAAYGDFASVGVTTQLTAKNLWCSAETFQLGAYGTTIRKMTKTINGVKINYLGY